MSLPAFSVVKRDQAWWGRYNLSMCMFLAEAGALRVLEHAKIDNALDLRARWGHKTVRSNPVHPGTWQWEKLVITERMRDSLHDFCDFLKNTTTDHKIMITGDWIYLYTNSVQWLETVGELPYVESHRVSCCRVDVKGRPGVITLQRPAKAWRSYLRGGKISADQKTTVANLVRTWSDVRASPGLLRWFTQQSLRLNDYFFLDHDDPAINTMLALAAPGLIRKTLPIETAK